MAFENTITEQDLDADSRRFVNAVCARMPDSDPDLDVDGLSDSLLARVRRFFAFGRE